MPTTMTIVARIEAIQLTRMPTAPVMPIMMSATMLGIRWSAITTIAARPIAMTTEVAVRMMHVLVQLPTPMTNAVTTMMTAVPIVIRIPL